VCTYMPWISAISYICDVPVPARAFRDGQKRKMAKERESKHTPAMSMCMSVYHLIRQATLLIRFSFPRGKTRRSRNGLWCWSYLTIL